MIFVYPAIISGSVDSKIAPAIARTLEQYFLLHLQEAISNNEIRLASSWRQIGNLTGEGTYGPLYLLTDNKIIKGKPLLEIIFNQGTESEQENVKNELESIHKDGDTVVKKAGEVLHGAKGTQSILQGKKISDIKLDDLEVIVKELHDHGQEISATIYEIDNVKAKIDKFMGDIDRKIYGEQANFAKNIRTAVEHASATLNATLNNIQTDIRLCQSALHKNDPSKEKFAASKDIREKEKEKRDKEKREEEKLKQYESHGMYKVEVIKGVSLKPTMANIQVMINYIGGPYKAAERVRSPEGTFREIAVGTKVLPLKVTNFDKIEDAILDDYFATKAQSIWRQYSRGWIRRVSGVLKKFFEKYHMGVDPKEYMNPIQANITLSSQGFINASTSFEKKGGAPSYYRYGAAIVIIDKRDLIKEEGSNFFLDKSQLNRMFKLGWNSFCILDETREEALFVSSLDGGYLHVIPYSYIFNSLGMDQVYQNVNDLRKKASPFRTSVGKMSNLIQRLKRESKLLEMVRLYKKVK